MPSWPTPPIYGIPRKHKANPASARQMEVSTARTPGPLTPRYLATPLGSHATERKPRGPATRSVGKRRAVGPPMVGRGLALKVATRPHNPLSTTVTSNTPVVDLPVESERLRPIAQQTVAAGETSSSVGHVFLAPRSRPRP